MFSHREKILFAKRLCCVEHLVTTEVEQPHELVEWRSLDVRYAAKAYILALK